MDSILGTLMNFLLVYKYWALFFIAFFSSIAIPMPASTSLLAAGAFAVQGEFNFFYIILTAFIGNVAGDLGGYFLARTYGETVLTKVGFRRLLHSKGYRKVQGYMTDKPQSLIYFSRFIAEIGPAVNLLSGIARVPIRTFVLYDVLGEFSYVMMYSVIGYLLGMNWGSNSSVLMKLSYVIAPLAAIGIAIHIARYRKFHASHYASVKNVLKKFSFRKKT